MKFVSFALLLSSVVASDKSSPTLNLEEISTQGPLTFRKMSEPYDGKNSNGSTISVSGGGWNHVYGELTSRSMENGDTFKIKGNKQQSGVGLCIETCDLDVFAGGSRFVPGCVSFYGDYTGMLVCDVDGAKSSVAMDRPQSTVGGITYNQANNCVVHVNSRSRTCTPLPASFKGKKLRAVGLVWNSATASIVSSDDNDIEVETSMMTSLA